MLVIRKLINGSLMALCVFSILFSGCSAKHQPWEVWGKDEGENEYGLLVALAITSTLAELESYCMPSVNAESCDYVVYSRDTVHIIHPSEKAATLTWINIKDLKNNLGVRNIRQHASDKDYKNSVKKWWLKYAIKYDDIDVTYKSKDAEVLLSISRLHGLGLFSRCSTHRVKLEKTGYFEWKVVSTNSEYFYD